MIYFSGFIPLISNKQVHSAFYNYQSKCPDWTIVFSIDHDKKNSILIVSLQVTHAQFITLGS
jgi:hypothetical protein